MLTAQGLRGFKSTKALNGEGCLQSFLSFGNAAGTTSIGVVDFLYLWTATAMNAVVGGAVVAVVSCFQHSIAECCDIEMFPNPSQLRQPARMK